MNRIALSAKLIPNAALKIYPGFPPGMCPTQADIINADLLAFIQSWSCNASGLMHADNIHEAMHEAMHEAAAML